MKKKRFFAFFLAFMLLSGCSQNTAETAEHSAEIFAMDNVMELKAYGNDEASLKAAEAEINRLDALLSKTNEKSDIYKFNNGDNDISAETRSLISSALEISESTDGAFDISVAPVTEIWGFTDEQYRVPSPEEIKAVLERVGYEKIKTEGGSIEKPDNALIDLGGIAKGYTSDRVIDVFRQSGINSAIISLGGNVQTLGTKPDGSQWKVGIQNPEKDENTPFIGVLAVNEKAVITSGAYQRFFEQDGKIYHHIIDPKTGCPAESGIISATVVSDSGMLADGLSTALFVMGLENAEEYWRKNGGFDFIIQTEDKKIFITEGIEKDFTSDFEYEIIR
ncbi:MAG: FAD:protein FMN transferase [Firmicutes bacterium]|nr:FAD:protein FMN transferase [Bacillota bacterium]